MADPEGKAVHILQEQNIPFSLDSDDLLTEARPDLVLVGTSATAYFAQNRWTARYTDFFTIQSNVPVVWYEDIYGTGEILQVHSCHTPGKIIVIDDFARVIVRERWKELWSMDDVEVGGKPTYSETLAPLIAKRESLRTSLRSKLHLEHSNETPIVTYASMGESPERVVAHIRAIGQAFDRGEKVIVRLHPKLRQSFENLMKEAENCLGEDLLDTSMITDTVSVILGSDLIITDYGGDAPYQATLAEIPVIMTMFPDCTEALKLRGYSNGVPPLLYAGACWGARDANDMEILATGIRGAPIAAKALIREKIRPFLPLLAPNAAGTIADIVESCFNSNQ